MMLLEKVAKKYRFVVHSVLVTTYIYFVSVVLWNISFYLRVFLGLCLILLTTFFIHYPNVKTRNLKNILMVLLLPSYLLGSALLALKYYPNLSLGFKLFTLLATGFLFYVVAIVDNIFLVVGEREETIPLYRAAVPWSQILLVIVAIPLFAGVFKIPTFSFIQAVVIGILSCILNLYQFWSYRYEANLIPVGVGGTTLFCLFTGYIVFTLGIATSFLPAESFLRGLVAATGLMFGLFYTNSYLRNNIKQKLLIQYFAIVFGFIVLTLLF